MVKILRVKISFEADGVLFEIVKQQTKTRNIDAETKSLETKFEKCKYEVRGEPTRDNYDGAPLSGA